jgi:MFS family permease
LGGGLCYIAITWYVLTLNNHISSVIINSLCFWLPSTLFGPFAGNWIDRLSRKNIYFTASMIRGLSFLSFATFLHYSPHILWCYGMSAFNGLLFTILSPAGFSLTTEIVQKKMLNEANATMDMIFEVGNIGGMGLAGILVQYLGIVDLFYIVGCIILAGSLMILGMHIREEHQLHEAKPIRIFQDFKQAVVYLKQHTLICLLYIINICVFLQIMTSPIVLAPYVKFVLKQGAHVFSLIEICLSVGIVIGSMIMPWLKDKIGWFEVITMGILITGSSLLSLYFVHNTTYTIIIYAINGICFTYWVPILSRIQALTAPHFQGRLQSFYMSFSATCIIIFYLILERGSHHIAVQDCYIVLSSFSIIALISLLLLKLKKLPLNDD